MTADMTVDFLILNINKQQIIGETIDNIKCALLHD